MTLPSRAIARPGDTPTELWRAVAWGGLAAIGALLLVAQPARAVDAETTISHGISTFGDLKYPADFPHFDYVNPDAPQGGTMSFRGTGASQTFDSLNAFILKGEPAQGLTLLYDSLLTGSADEPDSAYGLIAESVSYPDDFSSATFKLRPQARFHDGKPITPQDVIFSLGALKEASPRYRIYYKNVVAAEQTGEQLVTFRFDVKGNRELPLIVSPGSRGSCSSTRSTPSRRGAFWTVWWDSSCHRCYGPRLPGDCLPDGCSL